MFTSQMGYKLSDLLQFNPDLVEFPQLYLGTRGICPIVPVPHPVEVLIKRDNALEPILLYTSA